MLTMSIAYVDWNNSVQSEIEKIYPSLSKALEEVVNTATLLKYSQEWPDINISYYLTPCALTSNIKTRIIISTSNYKHGSYIFDVKTEPDVIIPNHDSDLDNKYSIEFFEEKIEIVKHLESLTEDEYQAYLIQYRKLNDHDWALYELDYFVGTLDSILAEFKQSLQPNYENIEKFMSTNPNYSHASAEFMMSIMPALLEKVAISNVSVLLDDTYEIHEVDGKIYVFLLS